MKLYYAIIVVVIALVSFGSYYFLEEVSPDNSKKIIEKSSISDSKDSKKRIDEEKENTCLVYITGEVKSPGIYNLKDGSRLYELIELSGGLTDAASKEEVNLARFIFDGEQIHIYAQSELEENKKQKNKKISINAADAEELSSLKGIGESKAQDIIDFREKNGPFKKLEDIMSIKGIKQALFEKIKDNIIL